MSIRGVSYLSLPSIRSVFFRIKLALNIYTFHLVPIAYYGTLISTGFFLKNTSYIKGLQGEDSLTASEAVSAYSAIQFCWPLRYHHNIIYGTTSLLQDTYMAVPQKLLYITFTLGREAG